jgi:nucleotide-binding universal stress UspA family protein
MRTIRTILFAADFSENSKEAFSVACSLAKDDKTRLHVLSVAGPDWVAEDPVFLGQSSSQFYKQPPDEHRLMLLKERLREEYAPDHPIDVEYHAVAGDVSEQVVTTAREIGADLIVIGTHGRTAVSWLISGSVATAVLRRAHCPVLALRTLAHTRKGNVPRVIVHPTDFSENSRAALEVARLLARDHGARLVIIHVTEPAIMTDGTVLGEVDPAAYRASLDDLRAELDGPDLKYPIETRLILGYPRYEILSTAEEIGCDMIVMGTHGRSALGRVLFGSVAESVLSRAVCPVMVVKHPTPAAAPTRSETEKPTAAKKTVSVY